MLLTLRKILLPFNVYYFFTTKKEKIILTKKEKIIVNASITSALCAIFLIA